MADIINIQTLVTAIVVAFPTSMLSVYLAMRKYRTEKWWDRKAECYIETVNSMNDIIRFCDSYLAELDGVEITASAREELEKKFHNGKMLLETQTNIGHLLISEDAHKDLLSLDRALYKFEIEEDITSQQIAEIRGETEDCLESFIVHAKNDLGGKWWKLF